VSKGAEFTNSGKEDIRVKLKEATTCVSGKEDIARDIKKNELK
jgi:hypothetical protein